MCCVCVHRNEMSVISTVLLYRSNLEYLHSCSIMIYNIIQILRKLNPDKLFKYHLTSTELIMEMNRTVIWLHVFYYKFSFTVQYRFTFNLLNINTNNRFYLNISFKIINIVVIVSLQWS